MLLIDIRFIRLYYHDPSTEVTYPLSDSNVPIGTNTQGTLKVNCYGIFFQLVSVQWCHLTKGCLRSDANLTEHDRYCVKYMNLCQNLCFKNIVKSCGQTTNSYSKLSTCFFSWCICWKRLVCYLSKVSVTDIDLSKVITRGILTILIFFTDSVQYWGSYIIEIEQNRIIIILTAVGRPNTITTTLYYMPSNNIIRRRLEKN